jgi:hypothetical protein
MTLVNALFASIPAVVLYLVISIGTSLLLEPILGNLGALVGLPLGIAAAIVVWIGLLDVLNARAA